VFRNDPRATGRIGVVFAAMMRSIALLLGAVFVVTACGSASLRNSPTHPRGSASRDYSVAAVRAAFARQGIHLDHGLGPPTRGGFALLGGRRSHLVVGVAVYEGPHAKGLLKPSRAALGPFAGAQYRRYRNVFVWWNRPDGGAVTAALSALQ
jgi:hypothetical protein